MTYKNAFPVTRKQHRSETAEDYTELIADLIDEFGEARVGKIAQAMGVSHVTALRTIERLQRDGFVTTSPRQPVLLTKKGEKLAAFSRERHLVVYNLLCSIGVPQKIAAQDVEGIEHHVSLETLKAMKHYLQKKNS
jgi:DtxR family transcriptional regulator, manganese transport regulator